MARPKANIVSAKAISKQVPKMYSTENVPTPDKIIKGHLFVGACDWYIVEYDAETDVAFGFAHLGDDTCAEWGYISIAELRKSTVPCNIYLNGQVIAFRQPVEWDRYWNPKKANQIDKIVRSRGC